MKKLFVILFLICSLAGLSQTLPPTPGTTVRGSSIAYPEDYNLSVRSTFLLPRFTDTTQASLPAYSKLDTSGRLIYTYNTNSVWVRVNSPKRWEPIASGGGGGLFGLNDTLATSSRAFNTAGFPFSLINIPESDTASYYLSINSLGRLIKVPKGQSDVLLSQMLTSTPTAGGADSIHGTGEINPWPVSQYYGTSAAGSLGTNPYNWQTNLDGGGSFNKRNVVQTNGNKLVLDSGSLIINTKFNTSGGDTSLYLKGPSMLALANGSTTFHSTSLQINPVGSIIGGGKYLSFQNNAVILPYQQPLFIVKSYPHVLPQAGVWITNDTITIGTFVDSNLYKPLTIYFRSRETGIQTEKWYVNGRGHQWMKEMPYSATVDSLVGWKNGVLTATLSSQFSGGGGGGGLSGGNLGAAFRLYYPPSQGMKTVFSSYGVAIDSSTSNQINFKVDTFLLETRLRGLKIADSLSLALTVTENDDNLTKVLNVLGTNTPLQLLSDGATITFTTANGINGRVTLGGNRTLSIPSPQNGKWYTVKVLQGAGGNTLALPGGGSAILRTAAGDSTVIQGWYDGSNASWTWFSDLSSIPTVATVVSVTSSTTLTLPSYQFNYIEVDATSGAVTLTLPAASAGKAYVIKKVDATANAVNVTTVEGAQSITTQYAGLNIYSNSSNWRINGVF